MVKLKSNFYGSVFFRIKFVRFGVVLIGFQPLELPWASQQFCTEQKISTMYNLKSDFAVFSDRMDLISIKKNQR